MASLPVFNPQIPITAHINGGMRCGLMVKIRGRIPGFFGRCMINFQNSSATLTAQDIIFHLSIRPSANTIVRNHFQNCRWGPEEKYGGNQIRSNEIFEIIILTDTFGYKIAVNGRHFQNFKHRLSPNLAQFVNITGDCVIEHIILEQNMNSQQQIVSMPQVITIPQITGPYYPTSYVVPSHAPPHYYQNSNTRVVTVTQNHRHIRF